MIVSSDNNWRGSLPVDWVSVWPGHWPWENDENLQISVKSCHQITPCPLQYSICPAPCVVSMSPIILGNQHHQILIIGTGLEAKIWTNVYSIHNGQFASAGARWCNIFVTNVFAKSGLILMLTMARCRAWPRSDRISREITKPLATEAARARCPHPRAPHSPPHKQLLQTGPGRPLADCDLQTWQHSDHQWGAHRGQYFSQNAKFPLSPSPLTLIVWSIEMNELIVNTISGPGMFDKFEHNHISKRLPEAGKCWV